VTVRRSILVLVAVCGTLTKLPAQSAASVTPVMDAWWARTSHRSPGKWGIVVADQSGKVLWQVNQAVPMIPASTVKVLTTGFARTAVGGDARRATRVVGTGQVDTATGTWLGRWALELNGDPTLERPDRAGPTLLQLAQQLSAIGIRRLVGPLDVITTGGTKARSSYPSVWADRFRGRIYAPPIGPVTLNENLIHVTVGPGPRVGSHTVVIGDAPAGVGAFVYAIPISLVIATLLAIAGFHRNRAWGLLFSSYAALIWAGSIFFGWHYFVDGPVAAAMVYALWCASNPIALRIYRGGVGSPSAAALPFAAASSAAMTSVQGELSPRPSPPHLRNLLEST